MSKKSKKKKKSEQKNGDLSVLKISVHDRVIGKSVGPGQLKAR